MLLLVVLGCRREPAPNDKPVEEGPEPRARRLIEALERGDPEPLARLLSPETTWDGMTLDGIKAANFTRPEDIAAAGKAARDLTGEFRRIGFVWTEGDNQYVHAEHAAGDFIFMVKIDDKGRLGHLTFTMPDMLPRTDCSVGASSLGKDGTIFVGPSFDAVPVVAIVGSLGGADIRRLNDLAVGLSCKGVASLVVPEGRPLDKPPATIRFAVAHERDRALLPASVEPLVFDNFLPKPDRTSGRAVIDSSHVAQAVIDQIAARVEKR